MSTLVSDSNFMMGVAARIQELEDRDYSMLQTAGVSWLRVGDFKLDVLAFLEGRDQPEDFYHVRDKLREMSRHGFQFVGITPGPREFAKTSYELASPEYFDAVARVARFFAETFGDIIQWWQVANELDIWIFRDKLTMEQSVEFLKVGIRSMKDAVPNLKVGINITLFPSLPGEVDGNTEAHEGLVLAHGIYGDQTLPVDFAGFDSYPGSWRKGGPDSWDTYLDSFYELTGKPIVIMEYGYASAGGQMSAEEIANGSYPCDVKKWKFSWRGEHSEQMQAEYVREALSIFQSKPFVLGAFYYNWRDAEHCWQCKEAACPAETAWGLLDSKGTPKLSYGALLECAQPRGCLS